MILSRPFAPTTTYYDPTLSARAVGARTDNVGTPVDDLSAEEDRLVASLFTAGILTPFDGFKVAERAAGANMSVDVGSGSAKVDLAIVDGVNAGQGRYWVRLDDVSDNLTIEPAHATLPRIDEVYLVVLDDSYDSSGLSLPRLSVRKGDAAATPSSPGPDSSWDAYLLLATVSVGASVSTITDSDIVDDRYSAVPDVPMVPVGSVLPYAGATAPTGFLMCDGSAVSRTTYARLFAVLGTTFGVGDGSTTFNVPNLLQRFVLGKGTSGTGSTLGGTGGLINHTHAGPSHTHTGPSHTHTGPSHTHTMAHTHTVNPGGTTTTAGGDHTHGGFATSESAGDGAGPSAGAAGSGHYHAIAASGTHTHVVDITSFTSGGESAANTGASGTGSTGASGTGSTGASGTGETDYSDPPYLALNHIVRY